MAATDVRILARSQHHPVSPPPPAPPERLWSDRLRGNAEGVATDTSARAAAAYAAARLGLGQDEKPKAVTTAADAAEAGKTAERVAATGGGDRESCASASMPVMKTDSVFPKGRPTPVLVKLPEDEGFDGGENGEGAGVGFLLVKEELEFSEVYAFSKHVRIGATRSACVPCSSYLPFLGQILPRPVHGRWLNRGPVFVELLPRMKSMHRFGFSVFLGHIQVVRPCAVLEICL